MSNNSNWLLNFTCATIELEMVIKDSNPFPSRSLDVLLSGLKHHLNPEAVDILSKKDP